MTWAARSTRSPSRDRSRGFVQGIGYALTEELVWDGGALTNPSMMDYKAPSAMDVPVAINPIIVEHPEPSGPFGAKAIGEPGLIGVAPAIANAVADATGLWDGGALTNPSMMDYKAPSAMDVPVAINPIIVEHPEPSGPFGAKAIGEPGLIGVAPAIANAVADATGLRLREIPMTPERVLRALKSG